MKILRNKNLILQLGIFLLGFCGSLYVSLTPANSMMNWYNIDDAFYYYKVAQNVLTGHGFTFDQINPTNGFHPLWMIVCLGVFWLSRFNLILPLRALILVSGIFNALTGVFLYRLLRKIIHPFAAILGALVWMLLPSIYNITAVHGMEAVISAFFLVLFLSHCIDYVQKNFTGIGRIIHLVVSGLLAALAILSRLDNVFIVFVIGVFMLLRIQRMNRLLVFDLVAILFASILSWIIRFGISSYEMYEFSLYPLLIIGLIIKPILLFFTGFYSDNIKNHFIALIIRFGFVGILSLMLEYGVLRLLVLLKFNFLIARSVILLDVAISLLIIFAIRLIHYRKQTGQQIQFSPWKLFTNWLKTDLKGVIFNGLTFAAPVLLIIGIYMGINKSKFGTFTPVSGQIKAWWGTLSNTVYSSQSNLVELLGLSPSGGKGPWSILTSLIAKVAFFIQHIFKPYTGDFPTKWFLVLAFLVFVLMVFLLSRKNGYLARKSFSLLVPALIIGCFLQIFFYNAQSYSHTRSWYWVGESLVLVLLGAIFSSRLFEKLREWTKSELLNKILLMAGMVLLLFLHTRLLIRLAPQTILPENAANYLATTRELEKYTNEGTLIGMTGGGTTAYFIENRTVVNLDGLINSYEYFKTLKTGTARLFLDKLPLDYVFGKPYILLETQPYDQIFIGRLEEIGFIHGAESFTLFRYLRSR